jgi:hypothetical protein
MLIAPSTFSVVDYLNRKKERLERIKKLLAGDYEPTGLMDLYYGDVSVESNELPTFSKF